MMDRAYFVVCLLLGRLLRSARYTQAPIVRRDGPSTGSGSSRDSSRDEPPKVRKRRSFYAPLLIWMGGLVVRILDTGQRVLPQREWEQRERLIYQTVYGASIQVEADGTLVLPFLEGQTLAALLEDRTLDEVVRNQAIERAVVALSEFHQAGFTHADAMAENVLVDSRVAHWFDFETIHDPSRSMVWRRGDDVRALLSTCLIRTAPAKRSETVQLILGSYTDEGVARVVASSFTSVWRRSLAFHLAQAALSFQSFHEIGRLLRERRQVVHQ